MIHTDASRVRQALINLIGNSIKFTSGGSVTVVGRFIHLGTRPQMQFDIIDTGIGITAEQIERIFDPLSRPTIPLPVASEAPALAWPSLVRSPAGSVAISRP